METRQYLIYAGFLFALMVAVAAVWYALGGSIITVNKDKERAIEEPLDVVFDFYNELLEDARANGGVRADNRALQSPRLASSTRTNLIEQFADEGTQTDPLLCQTTVPDKIKVRVVHEVPSEVEVMVMSHYASSTPTGFALVKLALNNRNWMIDSITCSQGDVLEEREFSFEQTGQLLKNVPAPLDNNYWHLVFTENRTPGHTAQLTFSSSSRCTLGGQEAVCDPATFLEATTVTVRGTMTETGVTVQSMTLTPQE